MQVREILLQGNARSSPGDSSRKQIALDPKYALAYMYLGSTHFTRIFYTI